MQRIKNDSRFGGLSRKRWTFKAKWFVQQPFSTRRKPFGRNAIFVITQIALPFKLPHEFLRCLNAGVSF